VNRTFSVFFLLIIFVLPALLTTVFFNPKDILSNTAVYTDDYAMHLSQCIATKRFVDGFGNIWGYDPFLLAGFPRETLVNADNRAWELVFYIFSPLIGPGRAFKIYPLFFLFLYPFAVYRASRNFSRSRETALITAAYAIVFFHLSLAIDFFYCGMISYMLVCFFSFYFLSKSYQLLKSYSWKRYASLTIVGALMLLCHLLSFIHIIIPCIILFLFHARHLTIGQRLSLLAVPIIIAAANSPWLTVFFHFLHYISTDTASWRLDLQIDNIFEPLNVYVLQQKSTLYKLPVLQSCFIDALLLVLGFAGLNAWWKRGERSLVYSFAGGFVFLFLLTFYGSHISFTCRMQPERFSVPLALFTLFPAGTVLSVGLHKMLTLRSKAYIFFALGLCFIILYRPVIKPFGTIFKHKVYRLNCQVPEGFSMLLNVLEKTTDMKGRILIEDSEWSESQPVHEFFGGHLPALFPEYLKRHYLSGPRPYYPIQHGYAAFIDGRLFQKDITQYPLDELKHVFKIYNVKWVVCWSGRTLQHLSQFPEHIKKIAETGKFTLFEVDREPSFFIKGSGSVAADYNRLELKDVVAVDNEVILSFHWMEYFQTIPPLQVERVTYAGDPVGFIKIINPPPSFSIYNAYRQMKHQGIYEKPFM
jgi:hypothetical protein